MNVKKIAGICCILFLVQGLCAVVPAMPCGAENDGPASGGDSVQAKVTHMLGLVLKPGYLFPTDEFFKGANNAQKRINSTLSGHIEYGVRFSPHTEAGRFYPHAVQGIGIGYNTFFHPSEMGNPLSVYVFQTSRIANITPTLSFDYEWNFGASFGWKKYDRMLNPMNRVVGSKVNAYIYLEFLFNWQVSPDTRLRAGVGLTHYSNGNTRYPNSGVNTIGASVGVVRFFGKGREDAAPAPYLHRPASPFRRYVSYDLVVYGATRKKGVFPENSAPMLAPGSFAIVGLNFNPLYNIGRYFRAGLSLDVQYDESANIGRHIANEEAPPSSEDLRFYRPSFREQFSMGLSVRAEIVMPVFSINLGIGKNFLCKGADTDSFYQTFVLKTSLTKRLFLHTGYQLYRFRDPNNLMLGIGYRFNAR